MLEYAFTLNDSLKQEILVREASKPWMTSSVCFYSLDSYSAFHALNRASILLYRTREFNSLHSRKQSWRHSNFGELQELCQIHTKKRPILWDFTQQSREMKNKNTVRSKPQCLRKLGFCPAGKNKIHLRCKTAMSCSKYDKCIIYRTR